MTVQGRRVYPREDGGLYLAEGDYGFDPRAGCWEVRPPGQQAGSIRKHEVTEHEDGTITVSPSIVLYDADELGPRGMAERRVAWHGFLERGTWRTA